MVVMVLGLLVMVVLVWIDWSGAKRLQRRMGQRDIVLERLPVLGINESAAKLREGVYGGVGAATRLGRGSPMRNAA